MQAHAERFTLINLIRLVEQFAELTKGFDSQLAQRIAMEALLIRVSKRTVDLTVDSVIGEADGVGGRPGHGGYHAGGARAGGCAGGRAERPRRK